MFETWLGKREILLCLVRFEFGSCWSISSNGVFLLSIIKLIFSSPHFQRPFELCAICKFVRSLPFAADAVVVALACYCFDWRWNIFETVRLFSLLILFCRFVDYSRSFANSQKDFVPVERNTMLINFKKTANRFHDLSVFFSFRLLFSITLRYISWFWEIQIDSKFNNWKKNISFSLFLCFRSKI